MVNTKGAFSVFRLVDKEMMDWVLESESWHVDKHDLVLHNKYKIDFPME